MYYKLKKDYKCEQGYSLFGTEDAKNKKYGVCVNNDILRFETPVTLAKISEKNTDTRYTKFLTGKTLTFYWGSDEKYLPYIDLNLQGGSFCQGETSSLVSKWPLFDPKSFFKPAVIPPAPNDQMLNQYLPDPVKINPNCPDKLNSIPEPVHGDIPQGEKNFFISNLKEA